MRIDAVDGLRAIAMTMVIAQHCGLLPFGWTGVWLFFVISGYVITAGFVNGDYAAARPTTAYVAFMGRRALRIVPVYLLYLGVGTMVVLASGGASRLTDLPYLLSFTYNWHMVFEFWPGPGNWGPFGHLWTLSVEQQFYLLFPLLALLLPARRQVLACSLLIAAGPLVRWGYATLLSANTAGDAGWLAFAVYAATPCHVDAFLMGSLIARLEPRLRASPRVAAGLWGVALAVATGYAAVYVAINHRLGAAGTEALRNVVSGILYGQHREVFVYLAIDLLAAAALVHVLLRRPGTAVLAWGPIAWVGRVSYGGYLFHALVIWAISHSLLDGQVKELPVAQRLLTFAGVWLVTVALASVSFRWFETPVARRWRGGTKRRPVQTMTPRTGSA
ncbi:acyltransferase family protein [Methylibium sp.]|uniref:acyltransferase family protein n=1 Tax=Methylibium sp. TaxID=2067992 RepID=UPI003D0EECF9